ncbi:NUDIX domain-containing protein [Paenactinomyces guangxiensis]|uniref:NUDIX domain-containing protein n=1 Tax=Paenactinomyces guangxiensis TaxID=1490290 RepID=A0A7W1WQ36_9BACL|nr:NUDIX domain-containing protein [Paenactinomyces guangxiensis]MBA4493811.1 NUDIX domain-containing protein [Paenactinomyces guangxiensis]MBH8591277.1 NUDIX domain-containing protein [Paenactinomyces guangxiensis]
MGYTQGIRNWLGHRPHLLVGAHVLVINEKDQLLLQQGAEGSWVLPGGLLIRGETLEDTARRQVYEQTGLVIGDLHLVRVFSGEKCRVTNEDQKYIVATVYVTRDILGNVQGYGTEFKKVHYFDFTKLPKNIDLRFQDFIEAYQQLMLQGSLSKLF